MRAKEFVDKDLEEGKLANLAIPLFIGAAGTAGLEVPKLWQKPPAITAPAAQSQAPITSLPATKEELPVVQAPKQKLSSEQIKDIVKITALNNNLKGQELAQFLAQCAHESANFTEMEENLNYSSQRLRKVFPQLFSSNQLANAYQGKPELIANYIYASKMGNGDEKSGDGWRYRGRGIIHLTGKFNYKKAGDALGLDLVNNPDLAADPEIATDIALWYWKFRVKPKVKNLGNTKSVTQQINPAGLGLQSRQNYYNQFKSN